MEHLARDLPVNLLHLRLRPLLPLPLVCAQRSGDLCLVLHLVVLVVWDVLYGVAEAFEGADDLAGDDLDAAGGGRRAGGGAAAVGGRRRLAQGHLV
jgi:hypothetical protein